MSEYIRLRDFTNNSTLEEKKLFEEKLSFVISLTRAQIRFLIKSPLIAKTIHISPGKEIYEKVLNTKTPEIWANVCENVKLLEELKDIALEQALEVLTILKKTNYGNSLEVETFEEESELLYQLRYIVQKLTHEKLKNLWYDINIKQVYLYQDLPIYKKFKDIVSKIDGTDLWAILKDSNVYRLWGDPFVWENANEIITRNQDFILFIDEFIKYYQENEELFIERYKVNEWAWEIAVYHLERLIESSWK